MKTGQKIIPQENILYTIRPVTSVLEIIAKLKRHDQNMKLNMIQN